MTDVQIGQIAENFVRSEWIRLGIVGWEERGSDFMGEVAREADRLKRSISILTSFGFEIRPKPQAKKASQILA